MTFYFSDFPTISILGKLDRTWRGSGTTSRDVCSSVDEMKSDTEKYFTYGENTSLSIQKQDRRVVEDPKGNT